MKKILSFLLALVLMFSLAACGSPKNGDSKGDVSKTTDNNSNQASTQNKDQASSSELKPEEGASLLVWESKGKEGDFIKYVAKEFEKKYGVPVKYEEVGTVDAEGRLAQDGPAGTGADVFAAPHDHTGGLVASGLIIPNSVYGDRIKKEFMKAAVDGVSYGGKLYGYPTAIETYALFYNKDIFPKAPKTFDEIIAKAKEFNDTDNNKYTFMWDVANAYFSHCFIAGEGGYIFGKGGTDKNDVGIDSKGAIAGAKEMLKLKEILPVNSGDSSSQIVEGLFQEGSVGAMINGPWAVAATKKSGINFGIAPLPLLSNGKHPTGFSGIRTLFVSSYTKYPKAAQLFANFATSKEMLLKRYEMTHQIPPVKALVDEPTIKNDEYVAPFLEQAQYAVPMPSIPQMRLVWEPYGAAFAAFWNGESTPEDALKNAAETVREAIKSQE